MIPAGVSVRPTSGHCGEFGERVSIPVPVAPGRVDRPSGGDPRAGLRDLSHRPRGAGAPGRELPDELVAKAVRGDGRAREELLALIHPLVLRYCRARLGRQEAVLGSADDVAQDACMAVVGALPGYQLNGLSFRAFVYGIAAHKVVDALRARGRDRTEPVAELPEMPLTGGGPEQQVLDAERAAQLAALLVHLTPRQREVLVLRLGVGLSAEQTAQAVRSSPGAVRVTQHRALLQLRRIILRGGFAARVMPGPGTDGPGTDIRRAG